MWKTDKEWFDWWDKFYELAVEFMYADCDLDDLRTSPEYQMLSAHVAGAIAQTNKEVA